MSLTSTMWLWYNISWPITSFSIWIEPCTSNTSLNIRYLISTMKEKWAIGCIRIQSIISVLTKRVILKKKKNRVSVRFLCLWLELKLLVLYLKVLCFCCFTFLCTCANKVSRFFLPILKSRTSLYAFQHICRFFKVGFVISQIYLNQSN